MTILIGILVSIIVGAVFKAIAGPILLAIGILAGCFLLAWVFLGE